MSTLIDDNKALTRRFGEAMNSRKLHLLDEIVASEFVRHCQATPGVNVNSLADFKEFLKQDFAVFPDSVQSLKHMVAEGNLVAIWATYEGTQLGQMGPFLPSRKKMQLDFAAVIRIEGAKRTI